MKRLPAWFERTENLAIAAVVVVVFVRLHFAWWWLPVLFLAFDASMAGYLAGNRVGAVCYNLGHFYAGPAVLLLSYGLKFASGFEDTHLGRIGKSRLPCGRIPSFGATNHREPGAFLPKTRYTLARSSAGGLTGPP
jgi:Domain of unknown function (DUF4260)